MIELGEVSNFTQIASLFGPVYYEANIVATPGENSHVKFSAVSEDSSAFATLKCDVTTAASGGIDLKRCMNWMRGMAAGTMIRLALNEEGDMWCLTASLGCSEYYVQMPCLLTARATMTIMPKLNFVGCVDSKQLHGIVNRHNVLHKTGSMRQNPEDPTKMDLASDGNSTGSESTISYVAGVCDAPRKCDDIDLNVLKRLTKMALSGNQVLVSANQSGFFSVQFKLRTAMAATVELRMVPASVKKQRALDEDKEVAAMEEEMEAKLVAKKKAASELLAQAKKRKRKKKQAAADAREGEESDDADDEGFSDNDELEELVVKAKHSKPPVAETEAPSLPRKKKVKKKHNKTKSFVVACLSTPLKKPSKIPGLPPLTLKEVEQVAPLRRPSSPVKKRGKKKHFRELLVEEPIPKTSPPLKRSNAQHLAPVSLSRTTN